MEDTQAADVNKEDDLPSASVPSDPQIQGGEGLTPVAQDNMTSSTRNLLLVVAFVQGLISSVIKAPNLSSALAIVQNQIRSVIKDLNLIPALLHFGVYFPL